MLTSSSVSFVFARPHFLLAISPLYSIASISLPCRPTARRKNNQTKKRHQALGEASDAAARWLLLECVSRAVPLAVTMDDDSDDSARRLASLLARLATFELCQRPDAFRAEGSGLTVTAAAPADLLKCLRISAAHLPRPERPLSLFSEDHLTLASSPGVDAGSACPLSLGDVLVSVLTATPGDGAHEDGEENRSDVSEVVGAVVFQGYGRRPLSALAAIAIAGVCAPPGWNSRDDGDRLVSASRALCVAATFVKAEAAAVVEDDGEHMRSSERDLVAVFPAAMLAITSDDKVGEQEGFPSSRDFRIDKRYLACLC